MIRNTICLLFVLLHFQLILSEITFEKCKSKGEKNELCFESTEDDPIGEGKHVYLTSVDGQIYNQCDYGSSQSHACLKFLGDYIYRIDFQSMTNLKQSTYKDAKLFSLFGKPHGNHFQFVGEGKYCKELTATFEIDEISWKSTSYKETSKKQVVKRNLDLLTKFSAKFEQVCDGKGKLKGFIHYDDSEMNPNVIAETKTYMKKEKVCFPLKSKNNACFYNLQSPTNTTRFFSTSSDELNDSTGQVEITESWKATLFANEVTVSWLDSTGHQYTVVFSPGAPGKSIRKGHFSSTTTHPYPTPHHHKLVTKGFVDECKYAKGEFQVFDFEGGSIPAKQLKCFTALFEQHCEGQPAIRGRIHFSNSTTCKDNGFNQF